MSSIPDRVIPKTPTMGPSLTLSIKGLDLFPSAAVSAVTAPPGDGSKAENKFHTFRCVTANGTLITDMNPLLLKKQRPQH